MRVYQLTFLIGFLFIPLNILYLNMRRVGGGELYYPLDVISSLGTGAVLLFNLVRVVKIMLDGNEVVVPLNQCFNSVINANRNILLKPNNLTKFQ